MLPFTPVRDYTWRAFSYGAFNFNEHALSSAFTWTNPAHVVTIFGGEIFNYTNFVIDPEFTFSPFSLRWTFNYTAYELIRTYSFTPYAVTTYDIMDVPNFRLPHHLSRYYFNRLWSYNKHWHVQRYWTCRATCVGSRVDDDLDDLAPKRTCDADDILCPSDYTDELNKLLQATGSNYTKHQSCPVSNPCKVNPPPCYYLSTAGPLTPFTSHGQYITPRRQPFHSTTVSSLSHHQCATS